MYGKDAISSVLAMLGRAVAQLGRTTLTAIARTEAAQAALAAFDAQYAAALAKWREKKATFIGFGVKVTVAYLTDYFLLEPLARALIARVLPGVELAAFAAALFAPVPVIVAECAIAVTYARARDWEERFGTSRGAARWLLAGIIVAALPAAIVIALGLMSTVTAAVLGWAALAGRQALNIILGVVSFVLHVLLVRSGETARDLVDAGVAALGRRKRERVLNAAETDARRRYDATIAAASRYEAARNEHDAVHGLVAVYPFPESVLKLVRRELPNFARPRRGHDMPFISVEHEDITEDETLH
jgi:hypothetical protein